MMQYRIRLKFPIEPEDLTCPHCKSGVVEIFADGFLWTHECGAYGYYDDGEQLFPHAAYRVKKET